MPGSWRAEAGTRSSTLHSGGRWKRCSGSGLDWACPARGLGRAPTGGAARKALGRVGLLRAPLRFGPSDRLRRPSARSRSADGWDCSASAFRLRATHGCDVAIANYISHGRMTPGIPKRLEPSRTCCLKIGHMVRWICRSVNIFRRFSSDQSWSNAVSSLTAKARTKTEVWRKNSVPP